MYIMYISMYISSGLTCRASYYKIKLFDTNFQRNERGREQKCFIKIQMRVRSAILCGYL